VVQRIAVHRGESVVHPGAVRIVSPDGQRFLMNMAIEEVAAPITVILNWKAKP
jgi:hypothetical protein